MPSPIRQRVPIPTPVQHPHVVNAASEVALELVGMVHDEDPTAVWRRLQQVNPQTLFATVIALAAMVDSDRTPAELLEWINTVVGVAA